MNIHKSQLFWCELQGYKVLTHCQPRDRGQKDGIMRSCGHKQDNASLCSWLMVMMMMMILYYIYTVLLLLFLLLLFLTRRRPWCCPSLDVTSYPRGGWYHRNIGCVETMGHGIHSQYPVISQEKHKKRDSEVEVSENGWRSHEFYPMSFPDFEINHP